MVRRVRSQIIAPSVCQTRRPNSSPLLMPLITRPSLPTPTANLRTKILDFRGFDSSIILTLRGGILMSIGNTLEILSQGIFGGIIIVGRLGVLGNLRFTRSHQARAQLFLIFRMLLHCVFVCIMALCCLLLSVCLLLLYYLFTCLYVQVRARLAKPLLKGCLTQIPAKRSVHGDLRK